MMKRFFTLLVVVSLLVSGCGVNGKTSLPRGKVSPEWIAAVDNYRQEALSLEAPDVSDPISIMAVENGKVIFEQWSEGCATDSLFDVFSISKTVLALAVGCAVEEGLLNVDDKVVDYFPDKLPENVSDTLSSMTIGHLITMSCGLEETPRLLSAFSGKAEFDWIEEFFNSRQTQLPGTSFYYNFFSPYITSAILEKVTGMGVLDYIGPRLLEPLHITDLKWKNSPAGICVGGWGMYVCTEDLAKFGQLLLQHGRWNGRQLVPAEWVDTMTSNLIPSLPLSAFTKDSGPAFLYNPENDHSRGYGYYVWQGPNGTYRAEGLFGRHIIVNPGRNVVFVIIDKSNMDQRQLDLVRKHFGHLIY